jgi:hypothetical protein
MRLQRNVTLVFRWVDTPHCGARHQRMELTGAVRMRATNRHNTVTQSSSPRLLVGAFVVGARQLDGACVELHSASVAGSTCEARRHDHRNPAV